jgi:hypothetical protein
MYEADTASNSPCFQMLSTPIQRVHLRPLTGRAVRSLGCSSAAFCLIRAATPKPQIYARRYVPSLLAVERWRAGAWWDQTLQPLRSREVAARLPASAAAGACAAAADAPADGQQQEDRQLLAGLQV